MTTPADRMRWIVGYRGSMPDIPDAPDQQLSGRQLVELISSRWEERHDAFTNSMGMWCRDDSMPPGEWSLVGLQPDQQ